MSMLKVSISRNVEFGAQDFTCPVKRFPPLLCVHRPLSTGLFFQTICDVNFIHLYVKILEMAKKFTTIFPVNSRP